VYTLPNTFAVTCITTYYVSWAGHKVRCVHGTYKLGRQWWGRCCDTYSLVFSH